MVFYLWTNGVGLKTENCSWQIGIIIIYNSIIARKSRVEYSGLFYHIITRGNRKQVIFMCNKDRFLVTDGKRPWEKYDGKESIFSF